MPFENWDDVGEAVRRALGALCDGDFLILGEPTADPLPRRRLFRRRPQPASARYVQVLRIGELFTAECVGARSLGGSWEMTEDTIATMRTLGWRTPEEGTREFDPVAPNFDMYVAPDAAPTLVELLVASLRLLGARPEGLELQTSQ